MPYSLTDSILGVLVICGIAGAVALVFDVTISAAYKIRDWLEDRR